MDVLRSEGRYLIRLYKGEQIGPSLQEWAAKQNFGHASVSGIGAVTDVEIGFYNPKRKEYDRLRPPGTYELTHLTGNLAWVDGAPFLHAHVGLGGPDGVVLGGHLFAATITATAEIFVEPSPQRVERVMDDEVGLKLWSLGR